MRAETQPGADEDVAELLAILADCVNADEPGCTSYVVTRMIGSSEHFAVHARFLSWDAFHAHADTPHLARVLPRLSALLATPISMELFVELAPLARTIRVDDARRKIEAERHRE